LLPSYPPIELTAESQPNRGLADELASRNVEGAAGSEGVTALVRIHASGLYTLAVYLSERISLTVPTGWNGVVEVGLMKAAFHLMMHCLEHDAEAEQCEELEDSRHGDWSPLDWCVWV